MPLWSVNALVAEYLLSKSFISMYSLVISYYFFFSFENIISAKLVLICSINLNDTKIELIKRLLVSNDLDAGNADAALGVPVSSEPHAWLSIGISWD